MVLGVAVGALRISGSSDLPDLDARWSLPRFAPPKVDDLSAEAIAARFWSEKPRVVKSKETAEAKKPVSPWRFVGTVDQGPGIVAAIEIEGSKVRQFKTGDALPDGSIVTEILEGSLSFEHDGAPKTLHLFVEKKPE